MSNPTKDPKITLPLYAPQVTKLIICIAAIIFTGYYVLGNHSYTPDKGSIQHIVSAIIFTGSIFYLIVPIVKISNVSATRTLTALKSMNIDNYKTITLTRADVKELLKTRYSCYIVFYNQITVMAAGARTVYKGRSENYAIDYKYYYLEDIKNDRTEKTKYMDFEQFMDVIDQINGHSDTFEIISVDRIIIPKAKKTN